MSFLDHCESGNFSEAKKTFEDNHNDIDVNATDARGLTALHYVASSASSEEAQDFVSFLLAKGAKITATSGNGQTPLHRAASAGNGASTSALIEAGAQVNVVRFDGKTPLHVAAGRGDVDVVNLLLGAGAFVDQGDNEGFSPYLRAVASGKADVAAVLVDAGADTSARSKTGRTALHVAAASSTPSLKMILGQGNVRATTLAKDNDGNTPLHIAAERTGGLDAVKALVKANRSAAAEPNHAGHLPMDVAAGPRIKLELEEHTPYEWPSVGDVVKNVFHAAAIIVVWIQLLGVSFNLIDLTYPGTYADWQDWTNWSLYLFSWLDISLAARAGLVLAVVHVMNVVYTLAPLPRGWVNPVGFLYWISSTVLYLPLLNDLVTLITCSSSEEVFVTANPEWECSGGGFIWMYIFVMVVSINFWIVASSLVGGGGLAYASRLVTADDAEVKGDMGTCAGLIACLFPCGPAILSLIGSAETFDDPLRFSARLGHDATFLERNPRAGKAVRIQYLLMFVIAFAPAWANQSTIAQAWIQMFALGFLMLIAFVVPIYRQIWANALNAGVHASLFWAAINMLVFVINDNDFSPVSTFGEFFWIVGLMSVALQVAFFGQRHGAVATADPHVV